MSVLAVPLALIVNHTLELLADSRVSSEVPVRLEDEDAVWRRRLERLAVVLDVPDTRRAVLGLTGAAGVYEALLAGAVGAEKCGKVDGIETLVLEQAEEALAGAANVWEEAIRVRGGGVLAADPGLDLWASRAGDRGMVCRDGMSAVLMTTNSRRCCTYCLRMRSCPQHRPCTSGPSIEAWLRCLATRYCPVG